MSVCMTGLYRGTLTRYDEFNSRPCYMKKYILFFIIGFAAFTMSSGISFAATISPNTGNIYNMTVVTNISDDASLEIWDQLGNPVAFTDGYPSFTGGSLPTSLDCVPAYLDWHIYGGGNGCLDSLNLNIATGTYTILEVPATTGECMASGNDFAICQAQAVDSVTINITSVVQQVSVQDAVISSSSGMLGNIGSIFAASLWAMLLPIGQYAIILGLLLWGFGYLVYRMTGGGKPTNDNDTKPKI